MIFFTNNVGPRLWFEANIILMLNAFHTAIIKSVTLSLLFAARINLMPAMHLSDAYNFFLSLPSDITHKCHLHKGNAESCRNMKFSRHGAISFKSTAWMWFVALEVQDRNTTRPVQQVQCHDEMVEYGGDSNIQSTPLCLSKKDKDMICFSQRYNKKGPRYSRKYCY